MHVHVFRREDGVLLISPAAFDPPSSLAAQRPLVEMGVVKVAIEQLSMGTLTAMLRLGYAALHDGDLESVLTALHRRAKHIPER